ncbi:hypothetical protein ACWCV9_01180 [Streptomyces sp. NPDC001606]
MELGPSHGIRFRFDDGLLGAALLDMHRKPALPLRERLLGTGVRPEPLPTPEVPATRREQRLGIGTRHLELTEPAGPDPAVALELRFELSAPLEWRLTTDATTEPTAQGARCALPGRVTLTVETTAACTVDGGEVRVALPAGGSRLVLTLTSLPVFDVGDTVVVCRPDQIREAAVVVSCLPGDRLTPVVAVEPPPLSEADYIALYERFAHSQNVSMQRIGGKLGMAEVLAGGPELQRRTLLEIAEHQQLAKALSGYRSWLKHNEMASRLVTEMRVRRAVFLADFAPEELNTLDPALREEADRVWSAHTGKDAKDRDDPSGRMFAGLPEHVRLHWDGLTDLTTVAWQRLRAPGGEPEQVLEVPEDDPASYVAALYTALRTGTALRPVATPGTPLDPLFAAAVPDDADEATLVENTADVNALLGAVYAHHRGARLVITPPPDLAPVRAAVDAQQRRITGSPRALDAGTEEADRGGKLRRWLSTGLRNPYRALEAAVTAQVAPSLISAVGDRRLTAFTTGMPYSFVRTQEADWSRKPIGHVAADPALIILNEIYSAGIARSAGTFSLVFDPGFFQASETEDVMGSMGGHFTHPILLPGPDELMLDALTTLPRDLPVELLFFNTHGLDDGIVLGEALALENWRIPQWLTLEHRPLVFNNSCQSWTGVGREFVRVGARGYIGSLWSIPSRQAADFGRTVVHRITAEESPVSEAIVNTGLPAGIERSYLYVGTASGRLDQWRDRTATAGEAALAECAILARAALGRRGSLTPLLHREMTALRRTVEHTPHGRTPAYLDVLLDDLALTVGDDSAGEDAVQRLVASVDALLPRLDLPAAEADRRWAVRFTLTGLRHERRDELAAALAAFRRSVDYGEACPSRSHLLLRMAQLQMRRGHWEEARGLAQEAYDLFQREDDQTGLLQVSGLLGQLSKRLRRYDEAMRHAREGYARAVELADREQQGAFKLDEATLHQLAGDHDAAIAAATTALELARIIHHDQAELAAVGRLCVCHREKGDLATAEEYATVGLAQAERLGVPREAASFHWDVAEVLRLRGRPAEALVHYRAAVDGLVRIGAWELAAPILAGLAALAEQQQDADALWSAAVWGAILCSAADPQQWSSVLPLVIDAVTRALELGPFALTERRMAELSAVLTAGGREGVPEHMQFLGDVFTLLLTWLVGQNPAEVTEFARHLDGQVDGVALGLAEFVSVPYLRRAAHGLREEPYEPV